MPISSSKSRDLADENNKILTEWKWFETTVLLVESTSSTNRLSISIVYKFIVRSSTIFSFRHPHHQSKFSTQDFNPVTLVTKRVNFLEQRIHLGLTIFCWNSPRFSNFRFIYKLSMVVLTKIFRNVFWTHENKLLQVSRL